MHNEWKYTIPIARALDEEDGRYLEGDASGPEPDTHGTMMDPAAIADFQRQIVERAMAGNPLPYLDSHGRSGVLTDLGWVVDASVKPNMRLRVKVKLDDSNPAAVWLHSQIQRGKQYGMSIKGSVEDFKFDTTETGQRVARVFKVILKEISNTTAPSWVPSFGTVLARSIDGESGEFQMSEETPSTSAVDEQITDVDAASTVENSDSTETVDETPTVDNVEAPDVDIERALSKADKERMKNLFLTMQNELTSLGVLDAPETPSETPEAEVARSEETSEQGEAVEAPVAPTISREAMEAINQFVTDEISRAVEPLRQEIAERDEYIDKLLSLPAGQIPAKVARDKFSKDGDPIAEQLSRVEDPEERLRLALGQIYRDK